MTVITRWDPFREFSTLQDRMNRLFRDSYSEGGKDESLMTSSFAPAVDVYEDEHNVMLKSKCRESMKKTSTYASKIIY